MFPWGKIAEARVGDFIKIKVTRGSEKSSTDYVDLISIIYICHILAVEFENDSPILLYGQIPIVFIIAVQWMDFPVSERQKILRYSANLVKRIQY